MPARNAKGQFVRKKAYVAGAPTVIRNLNRQIRGIRKRSDRGVRAAAFIVLRRSQQLTPVDTGNLRADVYVQMISSGIMGAVAEIGYRASYAVFVHEMDKNYKKGQWKYLETALAEKADEVLEVIRRDARVIGA